ncbi:MAG: hypothetical protein ACO3FE_03305 [Planctomycetaceae bacterium]
MSEYALMTGTVCQAKTVARHLLNSAGSLFRDSSRLRYNSAATFPVSIFLRCHSDTPWSRQRHLVAILLKPPQVSPQTREARKQRQNRSGLQVDFCGTRGNA